MNVTFMLYQLALRLYHTKENFIQHFAHLTRKIDKTYI